MGWVNRGWLEGHSVVLPGVCADPSTTKVTLQTTLMAHIVTSAPTQEAKVPLYIEHFC